MYHLLQGVSDFSVQPCLCILLIIHSWWSFEIIIRVHAPLNIETTYYLSQGITDFPVEPCLYNLFIIHSWQILAILIRVGATLNTKISNNYFSDIVYKSTLINLNGKFPKHKVCVCIIRSRYIQCTRKPQTDNTVTVSLSANIIPETTKRIFKTFFMGQYVKNCQILFCFIVVS
jgi:hypothetical protein